MRRRRPTTSTAKPPPWRASSALTGTASTSVAALDGEADVDRRLVETGAARRLAAQRDRHLDRRVAALLAGRLLGDLADPQRCARARPCPSAARRSRRRRSRASCWRVASRSTVTRRSVEDTVAQLAARRRGLRRRRPRPRRSASARAGTRPRPCASEPSSVQPVLLLEPLDRGGRRPVPLVVDLRSPSGSWPSARRLRSSWRMSSPSVHPRRRSRARPAAGRRAGTRPGAPSSP